MSDLYVRRTYCEEHSENDHWCDENYRCHGRDLTEVERKGFSYAKHIGGGWFKLVEKYRPPTQAELAWLMAADAHLDNSQAQEWPDDLEF
jgi:hypothetical protein